LLVSNSFNSTMATICVKKRDGKDEVFDVEKINKVLKWATDGLSGVSMTDIEINAKLSVQNGITTKQIHDLLIESAVNLISVTSPNYQYVASRLVNYQLRKDIWGGKYPPQLLDFLKKGTAKELYDTDLLARYSQDEIHKINEFLDHDRDFLLTYAGIRQLKDKYLINDRVSKQIFETPQFAYVLIAMSGFINYPKDKRLAYVKKAYNMFSKGKVSLPTPMIAGMRTRLKSFASCCLIDVDDTKESLTASATAISLATANRYGIGFNIGRVRPAGASIRNGEVVHTGVVPFLKIFEASVKAWQQNSIRGGSATCTIPWWHAEIEDVVVLKNNAGTDDNRVRKLDYTVAMSKLIYDRFIKDATVTLFNPHEVKELYAAFGHDNFDELYLACEANTKLKYRKVITARSLMSLIVKERVETGRIYLLNIDHVNTHSAWKDDVKMSNLCMEISQPLIPIQDFNDPHGEIGVCILSALNLLEIKNEDELEKACDMAVRFLDEVIDIQSYFNKAAENFATKRRSLGVGITNLAGLLAKNGLKYSSPEAPNFVDGWMEKIQYYLLQASCQLAAEKGRCAKYDRTKYSDGIFPMDTYKKKVDSFVTRKLEMDWDGLRAKIKEHGLRHSTLTATMPCESSSLTHSSTNGCEPVRSLMVHKTFKSGKIPVIVPGLDRWGDQYELAYDMQDNIGLINVNAAIQKWLDMNMSTNFYYNYAHYANGTLPDSKVIKEIMYAYSVGLHALYYNNTDDGDKDQQLKVPEASCAGGACAI